METTIKINRQGQDARIEVFHDGIIYKSEDFQGLEDKPYISFENEDANIIVKFKKQK
jgi:hypothetical protein